MEHIATIKTTSGLSDEKVLLSGSLPKKDECPHHTSKFLCAYCCKWYDLFVEFPSKPMVIPNKKTDTK